MKVDSDNVKELFDLIGYKVGSWHFTYLDARIGSFPQVKIFMEVRQLNLKMEEEF